MPRERTVTASMSNPNQVVYSSNPNQVVYSSNTIRDTIYGTRSLPYAGGALHTEIRPYPLRFSVSRGNDVVYRPPSYAMQIDGVTIDYDDGYRADRHRARGDLHIEIQGRRAAVVPIVTAMELDYREKRGAPGGALRVAIQLLETTTRRLEDIRGNMSITEAEDVLRRMACLVTSIRQQMAAGYALAFYVPSGSDIRFSVHDADGEFFVNAYGRLEAPLGA